MTWALAAAYAGAACLLLLAAGAARDPRVACRLETGDPPAEGRSLLAALGRRAPAARALRRVRERLLPGSPPEAVERVLGAKVVSAACGLACGALAWPSGPLAALGLATLLGAAGFALPDFALARRLGAARARAAAAVPDFLDAAAIGVTAGLTPRLALDRASAVATGILASELARARDEVALGSSWREALRGVAGRSGLADIRRLAIVLERGERLGTPVAGLLRELAREVREADRARAEERARRAPVLMLFPLVFCILPAFALAAVVPAVLVATRSIP